MGRRGHHEGSIFQRGDGRWAATIHLGYLDGKRHRKTFYGATRREVQEQLTVALSNQQQGIAAPSDRLSVGAYLDRWLEESARPKVRRRTYLGYAQYFRVYHKPEIGHIVLIKLSPQQVQAMYIRLLAKGLSARTVGHVHAQLRAALNQPVKWGLVARNVATLASPPRIEQTEVVPLNPDQARILLEALRGQRLEALIAVPLAMGLRPGEAVELRWENVNFEAGMLSVRGALQRLDGKLQYVELKTRRSRRTIATPTSVLELLRAHQVRQQEERILLGPEWIETRFAFTTWNRKPLEPRNVVRTFKRILRQAGLPDVRFHDLRHTAATLWLGRGVNPKIVSEMLGHADVSITLKLYSHVTPDMQQQATAAMDAALGKQ